MILQDAINNAMEEISNMELKPGLAGDYWKMAEDLMLDHITTFIQAKFTKHIATLTTNGNISYEQLLVKLTTGETDNGDTTGQD